MLRNILFLLCVFIIPSTVIRAQDEAKAIDRSSLGDLDSLPDEVIVFIIANLSAKDIANFSACCQCTNHLVRGHSDLFPGLDNLPITSNNGAQKIQALRNSQWFLPKSIILDASGIDEIKLLWLELQDAKSSLHACSSLTVEAGSTCTDEHFLRLTQIVNHWPQLKRLRFNNNKCTNLPISDELAQALRERSLENLSIIGFKINGAQFKTLLANSSLKKLRLDDLRLDRNEEALDDLSCLGSKLQCLNLHGGDFGEAWLTNLVKMPALSSLLVNSWHVHGERPVDASDCLIAWLHKKDFDRFELNGPFTYSSDALDLLFSQKMSCITLLDLTPSVTSHVILGNTKTRNQFNFRLPVTEIDRVIGIINKTFKSGKNIDINILNNGFYYIYTSNNVYNNSTDRILHISGNPNDIGFELLLQKLPKTIKISISLDGNKETIAHQFIKKLPIENLTHLDIYGDVLVDDWIESVVPVLGAPLSIDYNLDSSNHNYLGFRPITGDEARYSQGISMNLQINDSNAMLIPTDLLRAIANIEDLRTFSVSGYSQPELLLTFLPENINFNFMSLSLENEFSDKIDRLPDSLTKIHLLLGGKPRLQLSKFPNLNHLNDHTKTLLIDSRGSQITAREIGVANKISNLHTLDLLGTTIDEDLAKLISAHPSITNLRIFRIESPKAASLLSHIKGLDLSSWDKTVPQKLRNMPSLEEVHISERGLDDSSKDEFLFFVNNSSLARASHIQMLRSQHGESVRLTVFGEIAKFINEHPLVPMAVNETGEVKPNQMRFTLELFLIDSDITDDIILSGLRYSKNHIKVLDLTGSNYITINAILEIAKNCQKLEQLILPISVKDNAEMLQEMYPKISISVADR